MKHCLLTQITEFRKTGQKKREQTIIPGGKSAAITKLKKVFILPGEFFYHLNKDDAAIIDKDTVCFSFSLIEFPSLESAKLMLVDNDTKTV